MATTQDKIAGLYAAFFNRTPDLDGFNWWISNINAGSSSFEDIAAGFAQHPVFTATYGGMSNEEFINAIYTNMLGNAADSGGLSYYASKLNDTSLDYSRSDMVAEFIGGVLDVDLTNPAFDSLTPEERTAAEQRQALMQNKVQVSQSFIEQLAEQTNITNYENLDLDPAYLASQKILTDVTYDTTTVDTAIEAITELANEENAIDIINAIDDLNLSNVVSYISSNKDDGIDFTGDEGSKVGISNQQVSALTQESSQIISIDDFRSNTSFAGITGEGYSVVILDTGIDLNHSFFGVDANADGISDRIVYTRDFTNDGDGTVDDVNGHGTNVASIAASSSAVYTGMASGADIIALQVLSNNGQGSFAWIESALQWVVNNAQSYNIAAINMSLGDGSNSNTVGYSSIGDELAALDRLGVINVAASGNDYYSYQTEGASNPATDSNVVSVGATFDDDFGTIRWYSGATAYSAVADDITPFSQRSDTVVDIFAPGAYITGAAVGGGVSSMTGTSQASPHIAGIAVLAQELAEDTIGRRLSNSEFSTLLQQSGVAIIDGDTEDDNVTNTGDTYYRVDVNALGEAILALEDGGEAITPPPADSTDIEQTVSTKGTLSTDGSVSNSIETQNDHDWFKISLNSGVEYRFDLVSDSTSQTPLRDPYLELYNSSGEFISSNDDSGGGYNSSLTFIASNSGDYFLSARAYSTSATGDYILSSTVVNSAITDDFGETLNSAGALDTTSSETGQIEISGDKDWFSLNLTAGNIYTIDLVGNTLSDPYIYGIYNYNNELVSGTTDDNGGAGYNSKVIFQPIESGTYFVSAGANGSSTGTYTISLSEELSQDDYSSNTATTGFLTLGTPLTGDIETLQDTDWFAVTLDAGFEYTIDLEGSPTSKGTLSDTYIRGLYDSTGTLLSGTTNDDSNSTLNSQIKFIPSQTATYYLSAGAFGSGTGTYTLSLDREEVTTDDYSDTIYTTASLSLQTPATGNIETQSDKDWFSTTLTQGYTYTITMTRESLTDAQIYGIYDSNGSYINGTYSNGGSANSDAVVTFTPLTSGTYYISASGYGTATGTYTLDLTSVRTDDYTANIFTSGVASSGYATNGEIETADDSDWFAITMTSGYEYTVDLDGISLSSTSIDGIYNSNGTLISGTSDDAQVVFSPTSTGTYYISAGAAGTDVGTYELSVSQRSTTDDRSSTTNTTGTVSVGSSVTGNIETSYDTDWFAVSLSANTRYTIDLEGSSTTQGTLSDTYLRGIYDSDGTLLSGTTNDDSGTGLNSQVEFTTTASGTYYISAGGYGSNTGTYRLSVNSGTAVTPDIGSTTSSHGTISKGSTINGVIDTYYDNDWYAVTLTEGYSYDIRADSTDSTAYLYIRDADGNNLYSYDGVRDNYMSNIDSAKTFTPQESGTYYIDVYGYSAGTYTLSIDNGTTIIDDRSSTTNTTGMVTVGSSTTGNIETSYDTDWFAVSLSANTRYTIDLEGSSTTQGTLSDTYLRGIYDSDGTLLSGTTNDDSGTGLNSQVEFTTTASGTYYISAGGYGSNTGTYRLSVNSGTAVTPDIGSTTTNHGTIAIGETITNGRVDSYYDYDWYAVDLSTGYEYNIEADSSSSYVYVYIMDENGNYLYSSDGVTDNYDYSVDASKTFTPQESGTYYMSVYGYTSGATYSLSLEQGEAVTPDIGSTTTNHGTIAIGSSTTGNIETSYDTDWFAVNLTANTRYTIDLEGYPTTQGTLGDPYLRGIYDSDGTLLSSTTDDDSGTSVNSQVSFTPTESETYYISAGAFSSYTGTYTLTIVEIA